MQVKLDEEELTRSIIGAIGQLDTYELPDAKAYSNLKRYLTGYDSGTRQQLRDEVLATTEADFQAFGALLNQAFIAPRIAVLCDEKNAQQHTFNKTLPLL
jgi:Zn-dependent M16 (insulinase) family peptidase